MTRPALYVNPDGGFDVVEAEETDSGVPEILTVEQAAKFLQVGRTQLYEAIGRLEVPHRRIGRSIRLSRTALVRWFEECNSPRKRDP